MKGDMVELAAFVCYLVVVLAVGVYFFLKGKKTESGDKDYFLGGRNMNGLVAALSAGASDMSAWVLMGLPGSIYLYGMGQVWISVGLLIGTVCAWIFVAPRLRRYSIKANDSITIPQFLVNRFQSKNPALQIISAIIFIIAYCIYAASSIVACGSLFVTVFGVVEFNLFGLHVVMNELFYMRYFILYVLRWFQCRMLDGLFPRHADALSPAYSSYRGAACHAWCGLYTACSGCYGRTLLQPLIHR